MSESDVRRIPFDGIRIRHDSDHPFDDVVRALLSEVGETPVSVRDLAAGADTWEVYRQRVQSHVGPGGFMLFGIFDHGEWLAKAGIERKVLRLIIGNPLIAITMLAHDQSAGLFAPVELLVMDEQGGHSSVTYVQPSSLMVIEANAPLLAAAQILDDKLAALVASVLR